MSDGFIHRSMLEFEHVVTGAGFVQLSVVRYGDEAGNTALIEHKFLPEVQEFVRGMFKRQGGAKKGFRECGRFIVDHIEDRLADEDLTMFFIVSVVACTLERPDKKQRREFRRAVKQTIAKHDAVRIVGVVAPEAKEPHIAWMVMAPDQSTPTGAKH